MDAVYSAMSLRTTATSLAGTVELQPAVPAAGIAVTDPDELLFDALEVRVATSATPIAVWTRPRSAVRSVPPR